MYVAWIRSGTIPIPIHVMGEKSELATKFHYFPECTHFVGSAYICNLILHYEVLWSVCEKRWLFGEIMHKLGDFRVTSSVGFYWGFIYFMYLLWSLKVQNVNHYIVLKNTNSRMCSLYPKENTNSRMCSL